MAARFLDPDYHAMLGINTPEAEAIAQGAAEIGEAEKVQPRIKVKPSTHAPTTPQKPDITLAGTGTCSKCGGLMVQTGKCMTCTDCGETGGCG
jgi:exosome complex RNA-binding protein Csl4